MRFYQITLRSGLSVDQKSLVDSLSQTGADTIQTSRGLFTATDSALDEIQALLIKEAPGLSIEEVSAYSEQAELTPDMRALVQKHS